MGHQIYFLVLAASSYLIHNALASCDKNLLPELTFMLNGANLAWPCSSTKNIYTQSGRYVSKNVISTRMQIYKDEALVLMPRYKAGVPFTLGKMSLKNKNCQPTLEPFPCWSMQEEGNCQSLQSAVDAFLDPQVRNFFSLIFKFVLQN